MRPDAVYLDDLVSTHSRLKAAGPILADNGRLICRFNTQPPEGGWEVIRDFGRDDNLVSTHSRLKAAG